MAIRIINGTISDKSNLKNMRRKKNKECNIIYEDDEDMKKDYNYLVACENERVSRLVKFFNDSYEKHIEQVKKEHETKSSEILKNSVLDDSEKFILETISKNINKSINKSINNTDNCKEQIINISGINIEEKKIKYLKKKKQLDEELKQKINDIKENNKVFISMI